MDIKDIAARYFVIPEDDNHKQPAHVRQCRCAASHYYCLQCLVCRAEFPEFIIGTHLFSGPEAGLRDGSSLTKENLAFPKTLPSRARQRGEGGGAWQRDSPSHRPDALPRDVKQRGEAPFNRPDALPRDVRGEGGGVWQRVAGGLANCIDHTNLKPDAKLKDIAALCEEAKEHDFFAVCINPYFIEYCSRQLVSSSIAVCSVISFPLGAAVPTLKSIEAQRYIEKGADELDMVINIGCLKDRNTAYLIEEIKAVVLTAKGSNVLLKCIIETGMLSAEEIVIACLAAKQAGADYVKTSTGFLGRGVSVEDVSLMRKAVGPKMGVKASGGIKSADQALSLVQAGANRIGSSSSVAILESIAKLTI